MKEHTHLHPYFGTSVPHQDITIMIHFFNIYTLKKKYFIMEINLNPCYNRTEGELDSSRTLRIVLPKKTWYNTAIQIIRLQV